jgi:predicted nucleotidyltransferase
MRKWAAEEVDMDSARALTDAWLHELETELRTPGVVALALTGSMARGEATRHSDVDLLRFTLTPPGAEHERYTLLMRDERLVSLSTSTIVAKRAELSQPAAALFAVAGLRQMRILDDPLGALAQLQGEAQAFSWPTFIAAAASSRTAGVAMAFKLIESAQTHGHAVNTPHLVALARAGAKFENGKPVERPDESGGDQQAASAGRP